LVFLALAACNGDKPGEWSLFVYPDAADHQKWQRTDRFQSEGMCRQAGEEAVAALPIPPKPASNAATPARPPDPGTAAIMGAATSTTARAFPTQHMTKPHSPANSATAKPAAAEARESRNTWEDEGGSVDESVPAKSRYSDRVISGRIVQNKGGSGQAFTVELTHEDGHKSDHPCADMREGEAFIREAIPTPPKRDTSRDHAAGQS
jgi:hypothetical protein